jgi:subtilisin family serine protease
MTKIDPGLLYLQDRISKLTAAKRRQALSELAESPVVEVALAEGADASDVTVLAQFTDLPPLEEAGLRVRSVAGDVAVGEIDVAKLDALAELNEVVRIEASRPLRRELDVALPEVRANVVHAGTPGIRGTGVIVGIIDTGIDWQHDAFRRPNGSTRLLAIWDQGLIPAASETSPAGFGYGVEYRAPAINAALADPNPRTVVRHDDDNGLHGTHVAGIAAGDGSVAGQQRPVFTFIGVAPEADLVVVANNRGRAMGERGLGDSADTVDAVRYIFDLAASLGRPAVINQSQGDNLGAHDGTSILERAIDNLLGGNGRAMVKSAGNEGARNRHASGTATVAVPQTVGFAVPPGVTSVTVDMWYAGSDRFDISLTPPGQSASPFQVAGQIGPVQLPGGATAFVGSTLNDPGNGANRIFMVLSGDLAGNWSMTLRATVATDGRWDAWIQRNAFAHFLPPFRNSARTLSIPGTSHEIITAASFITKGSGVGSISSFSSLGPTRDGRDAPTVAAPGEQLMAPQPASTGDAYGLMGGTSMAAPMVTGTVALMLQVDPALTQADIKQRLMSTARSDQFTGQLPNHAWGAGKLDTAAALAAVQPAPTTLRPEGRWPGTYNDDESPIQPYWWYGQQGY